MSEINWMNKQELDYLLQSKYTESHSGLSEAMNIPLFTISDLNVTHRDASYWDKKGVLPKLETERTTRRRYTLKQAVWIKLIQQLRGFDISLAQIKKYKECVLNETPSVSELMKNDEIKKIVEEIAKKAGTYESYKEFLKDPEFIQSLEPHSIDVFETSILYTIIFKRDISYILFREGGCMPYCFDKHNLFSNEVEGFDDIMKMPHITLSISDVIGELIVDWSEKDWFSKVSLLTKEESVIFDYLRDNDVDELTIVKRNGILERLISVKKEDNISLDDFAKYFIKNGYQNIEIKTRDGKPVYVENKVSIKL